MQVFTSWKSLCPLSIHAANAFRSFCAMAAFSGLPKYPRFSPTPWPVNQSPHSATTGCAAIWRILFERPCVRT